MASPLTPQEHLLVAENILSDLTAEDGSIRMTAADSIALANAHIALALAQNAVPLLGDTVINDEQREIEQQNRYRENLHGR